jgi:hypothetical protein
MAMDRAVIDFKDLRAAALETDFVDRLFAVIEDRMSDLPLGSFCSRGGWPIKERLATIALLEDGAHNLDAVLYIEFTESGAACCSGDNFEYERSAELSLRIDKDSWQGQVRPLKPPK